MMKREIPLLSTLDHPHIVKIYAYAEDMVKSEFVLILEHLAGGDCHRMGACREATAARLVHQVLLALAHCHSRGILHRDVKPDNMVLTAVPTNGAELDCKLIDFGIAARRDGSQRDLCGTPGYIAPEIILDTAEFTGKADMWSLGVTAVEILTGILPFGTLEDHGGDLRTWMKRVTQYEDLEDFEPFLGGSREWQSCSPLAKDFIRKLLNPDPEQRLAAKDALNHQWLQEHKAASMTLTSEMLQSLAAYVDAPSLVRCCLYIIVARHGVPDLEKFGAAFLSIDTDGDGMISRDDLAKAIDQVSTWWGPSVCPDQLLNAADLDHTGCLNFTQFVAACIYSRHVIGGQFDLLLSQSFEALDADRDGQVSVDDIRPLFRERDSPLLQRLPQDRPFGQGEWSACLRLAWQDDSKAVDSYKLGFMGVMDDMLKNFACSQAPRPSDPADMIEVPAQPAISRSPLII
uniref:Non-specific serine/threonine protein kinase n=1 Tax=Noctiluca scintillans TaxID=2966 RepID=A0A7S1EYW1_NOCSC|mmetsp:Transcript_18684/g.50167  ORF Transcript_18684/g.50167 Transcript_18684/m.50167 type:complete len:460 (+) Transcript_18684:578-1957(+)